MPTHLNLLLLEDSSNDAELMIESLREAGFMLVLCHVDSKADYLRALDQPPDLILSDFTLPQFTALDALRLLQERGLDIPFIVVSGCIGEDMAVDCMRAGATDYLLKDRLGRLGHAVSQALDRKRLLEDKRQADVLIRDSHAHTWRIVATALDAFIGMDAAGTLPTGTAKRNRGLAGRGQRLSGGCSPPPFSLCDPGPRMNPDCGIFSRQGKDRFSIHGSKLRSAAGTDRSFLWKWRSPRPCYGGGSLRSAPSCGISRHGSGRRSGWPCSTIRPRSSLKRTRWGTRCRRSSGSSASLLIGTSGRSGL